MIYAIETLQPGDMVFSAQDIRNDGSFPDFNDDELLVSAGSRGVVINIGHIEDQPEQQIFLVRFELPETKELGPAIGCWPEDLEVAVN
ncbi:MAG: nitrogen fixation protein NifZ [Spongiibacteraceae bacterium]